LFFSFPLIFFCSFLIIESLFIAFPFHSLPGNEKVKERRKLREKREIKRKGKQNRKKQAVLHPSETIGNWTFFGSVLTPVNETVGE